MPTKTSLINKNDKLARQINRLKGRCERCGRDGREYQMHWCHVMGRRCKALRWHSLNNLLLCSTCHRWQHENPLLFNDWFEEKFPGRKKALQDIFNVVRTFTILDYQQTTEELELLLSEKINNKPDKD